MKSTDFTQALSTGDLDAIRAAPKTDVHSHAFYATRLKNLEAWIGHSLPKPPRKMNGLADMFGYADEVLAPHIRHRKGFEFVAESAIKDAIHDGVVRVEISFDIRITEFYDYDLTAFAAFLEGLVEKYRAEIDFRPEFGFPRTHVDDAKLMKLAHEAVELPVFRSIDLYSYQEACPPEAVKSLFERAGAAGLKLKAHVGEYGGAEEVRRTVELLELDEVQHGIGAIESLEVIRWLADNEVPLNISPSGNVMLRAVPDLVSHPIRVFFDHGIPVTINTDDLIIYDQGVSEEYLNLYRAGVFSAEELDGIRQASLTYPDG